MGNADDDVHYLHRADCSAEQHIPTKSRGSRMIEHRISNYAPADQDDLIRFFRTVFAEMGFGFDLDAKDRDLCDIPDQYQSDGGLFLLARHDGLLVGTIALRPIDRGIWELKRFYVRSQFQRNGIGAGLLMRLIEHVRAGSGGRIRLDTSFHSPAAISLFKRHRFVEIPRYNDDPFAEIFLELRIP